MPILDGFDNIAKKIPIIGGAFDEMYGGLQKVYGLSEEWLGLVAEIGVKWQEVSRHIAGETLDTSKIDALAQSVQNLFASGAIVREQDIIGSISEFHTRLGLAGRDLEEFTKIYSESNEILGTTLNVDNITGSLNLFGASGEEAITQWKQIVNIFRDFGVDGNKMLTTMKTLGSSFQELGYTAPQMALIFSEMDKGGVTVDRLSFAMSGFIARAASAVEQGKFSNIKDAYTDILAEAKRLLDLGGDAEDSPAVAFLNQWFGPKGGLAIIKGIKENYIKTVEEMNQQSGGGIAKKYNEDLDVDVEKTKSITEAFAQMQRQMEAAFRPISLALGGALNEASGIVTTWLSTNQSKIMDWSEGITLAAVSMFGKITEGFGAALGLLAWPLEAIKDSIMVASMAISGVMDLALRLVNLMPSGVLSAIGINKDNISTLKNDMDGMFAASVDGWKYNLHQAVTDAGQGVKNFGDTVTGLIPGIQERFIEPKKLAGIGESFNILDTSVDAEGKPVPADKRAAGGGKIVSAITSDGEGNMKWREGVTDEAKEEIVKKLSEFGVIIKDLDLKKLSVTSEESGKALQAFYENLSSGKSVLKTQIVGPDGKTPVKVPDAPTVPDNTKAEGSAGVPATMVPQGSADMPKMDGQAWFPDGARPSGWEVNPDGSIAVQGQITPSDKTQTQTVSQVMTAAGIPANLQGQNGVVLPISYQSTGGGLGLASFDTPMGSLAAGQNPGAPNTSPNGFQLMGPLQGININGRSDQVAAGDPGARLAAFAQWFNANIEPVREISGFAADGHGLGAKSNHTSGTALDINWSDFKALQGPNANATDHFTPAQMAAIGAELQQLGMTWGQYWTPDSRDPGHFEIAGSSYAPLSAAAGTAGTGANGMPAGFTYLGQYTTPDGQQIPHYSAGIGLSSSESPLTDVWDTIANKVEIGGYSGASIKEHAGEAMRLLTTGADTPQGQMARAIFQEAKRRGLSDEVALAAVATAIKESSLNPTANNTQSGSHYGLFQESPDKPRETPHDQINWFFDDLQRQMGVDISNTTAGSSFVPAAGPSSTGSRGGRFAGRSDPNSIPMWDTITDPDNAAYNSVIGGLMLPIPGVGLFAGGTRAAATGAVAAAGRAGEVAGSAASAGRDIFGSVAADARSLIPSSDGILGSTASAAREIFGSVAADAREILDAVGSRVAGRYGPGAEIATDYTAASAVGDDVGVLAGGLLNANKGKYAVDLMNALKGSNAFKWTSQGVKVGEWDAAGNLLSDTEMLASNESFGQMFTKAIADLEGNIGVKLAANGRFFDVAAKGFIKSEEVAARIGEYAKMGPDDAGAITKLLGFMSQYGGIAVGGGAATLGVGYGMFNGPNAQDAPQPKPSSPQPKPSSPLVHGTGEGQAASGGGEGESPHVSGAPTGGPGTTGFMMDGGEKKYWTVEANGAVVWRGISGNPTKPPAGQPGAAATTSPPSTWPPAGATAAAPAAAPPAAPSNGVPPATSVTPPAGTAPGGMPDFSTGQGPGPAPGPGAAADGGAFTPDPSQLPSAGPNPYTNMPSWLNPQQQQQYKYEIDNRVVENARRENSATQRHQRISDQIANIDNKLKPEADKNRTLLDQIIATNGLQNISEEDRLRMHPDYKKAKEASERSDKALTDAQASLKSAQDSNAVDDQADAVAAEKPWPKPPGMKSGQGNSDAEALGKGLVKGIFQELGLDGSVFSNFMDWGITKLGLKALNYGAGIGMNYLMAKDTNGGVAPGLTPIPAGGIPEAPGGAGIAQSVIQGATGIKPPSASVTSQAQAATPAPLAAEAGGAGDPSLHGGGAGRFSSGLPMGGLHIHANGVTDPKTLFEPAVAHSMQMGRASVHGMHIK